MVTPRTMNPAPSSSRPKKVALAVLTAIVVMGSLSRLGLRAWRHFGPKSHAGPAVVGYFEPGGAKQIPAADGKTVGIGETPIVGSRDFDGAVVEELLMKTTAEDPGNTYHCVLLHPTPEAAAKIEANKAKPVLLVVDGRAGSAVPSPLGDFDVSGRLLLASFPDAPTAHAVLKRVIDGLERKD